MYKKLVHNYLIEIVLFIVLLGLFGFIMYLIATVKLQDYKEGLIRYEGDNLYLYNLKPQDLPSEQISINFNYDNHLYTYSVDTKNEEGNLVKLYSEALKFFLDQNNIAELKVSVKMQDISVLSYIFSL
ncbi:MAG1140 family protein [Mycoplasma sp. Sp48II]|uniref:MAG1140 family protein n=1 Tax=unclassified Mycoplasma TaxID=2683645 RepID=UPI003AAA74A2